MTKKTRRFRWNPLGFLAGFLRLRLGRTGHPAPAAPDASAAPSEEAAPEARPEVKDVPGQQPLLSAPAPASNTYYVVWL